MFDVDLSCRLCLTTSIASPYLDLHDKKDKGRIENIGENPVPPPPQAISPPPIMVAAGLGDLSISCPAPLGHLSYIIQNIGYFNIYAYILNYNIYMFIPVKSRVNSVNRL